MQPDSLSGDSLDVLGIGVATLDTVGAVEEFPEPDGKTRVFDLMQEGGGPAATAMVACSRLGLRAGLIAMTGDDDEGRFIRDGLAKEGVDVSRVFIGKNHRSIVAFCFAHRKTAQRVIYAARYQLPHMDFEKIDRAYLKRAKILLIDGLELSAGAKAAEIIRGAGGLTVMDAGSAHAGYAEALRHIDYLVASWTFARGYTKKATPEEALEVLRWSGWHRAVAITLGPEGYIAAEGGHAPFRAAAFEVKAVDTTGAGDVFHGAFCAGLARRWAFEQCCVFASACAAMKCEQPSGRKGIPTFAQAIAFCRERDRRFRWDHEI
ncbi:MAG: PfkB family carbohydrate kinase [Candidatus Sumerlaeota bacterium]|nr:PfkB family carbohydrate kinase [Candidatus Sumerlaeota bacterium]